MSQLLENAQKEFEKKFGVHPEDLGFQTTTVDNASFRVIFSSNQLEHDMYIHQERILKRKEKKCLWFVLPILTALALYVITNTNADHSIISLAVTMPVFGYFFIKRIFRYKTLILKEEVKENVVVYDSEEYITF